uniref:PIN domain-containing protein n=1 Tax=Candidatus Kentrum sp. FM TaxID=2126340 RepID=A0A450X4R5_9GAMM|nr:MAG: hypothetical protein BECKFM1743C_GA0114222_109481 [Candidatus Kentron sp. FM]VFJ77040.1 MAG: hypothetical protein BECKFM1743A_GA0114220_109571 [Candidatus Kentron sp. FM]VFK24324.1 MAG: hypothetical protein BECKFM1743B_GA0114221_109851 [Candidatus Kentron sp. FM]
MIGYLASRPSRDVVVSGRQLISRDWWENQSQYFELRISSLVEEEASRGDPSAVARRAAIIADIPHLAITDRAVVLTQTLVDRQAVPKGSEDDALHIAISATQGAHFLLTWNFKHIDNAQTKQRITEVVDSCGYLCPLTCSPEELGEQFHD